MDIDTLKRLYVAELQEARSVEAQLCGALPKMVERASTQALRQALDDHLAETRAHLEKMDAILKGHAAEPRAHRDQSMQTILAEAEKWIGMVDDPACRDAALIASIQRVEHYEIAVYGTLTAWARQLGLEEDAERLHGILGEEKAADDTLTQLAKWGVNPQAAG